MTTPFIANAIAEVANMAPKEIFTQLNPDGEWVDTPPRPAIADRAYEQQAEAIKVGYEAKQKQREQDALVSSIAREVAKRVTVGRVEGAGQGSPQGVPLTIPEPRETIQAGIDAVGQGGRKAVFSELPFEDEDLPKGWVVTEGANGGYYASPKKDADEVVALDTAGMGQEALGYKHAKTPEDSMVVQVKDGKGRTVQDVSTNEEDLPDVLGQAYEVIDGIRGGQINMLEPWEAVESRKQDLLTEKSAPKYDRLNTLEGYSNKPYMDTVEKSTIGYGFNLDQPGAAKLWKAAGVPEDMDQVRSGVQPLSEKSAIRLRNFMFYRAEDMARARAKELGVDWNTMPEWHKEIVTDIAYNTGGVQGWSKVFRMTNPKMVLREARRAQKVKEGTPGAYQKNGKWYANTPGMDNRVARLGMMLGLINSVSEARKLGLPLTDMPTHEVVSLIKSRRKTNEQT